MRFKKFFVQSMQTFSDWTQFLTGFVKNEWAIIMSSFNHFGGVVVVITSVCFFPISSTAIDRLKLHVKHKETSFI